MDPRPKCRFCGRPWAPPEGVDATVHYCSTCSSERQERARSVFASQGRETVMVGGYVLRAKKV